MPNDAELLHRYAVEKSDDAFTEFVRQNIDFVFSAALRLVGGDAHHASDVAQHVFTAAARNAGTLARHRTVKGWLYLTTRNASANLVRADRLRQVRETEAHALQQISEPVPNADADTLRPVLDAALGGLNERDREVVFLRFFEGQDYAEIGSRISTTADAARQRVERALERMKASLARRGIVSTTAALSGVLTVQASVTAPAGLAASISASALSAVPAGVSFLVLMAKIKTATVALVVATSLTIAFVEYRDNRTLRRQLAASQMSAPAAVDSQAGRKFPPQPVAAPTPAEAARIAAKLSLAEIESKLAEIIREGLWRDGGPLRELIARIEPKDMEAALGFVERTATGTARRNLRLQLAEYWVRLDPAAAAAWRGQLPPGPDQQHLRRLVANLWAATDPEAALRLAGPAPEVFRRMALNAPAAAATRATQVPSGDDRTSAIRMVAQTWFDKEPTQTIKWIGTLENVDDRTAALSAVMRQLEPSDLSGMASYVTNLATNPGASEFTRDFAATWANGDARAAATWANALPEGSPARERAIGVIAEIWTRDDSSAAAAWIADLPPSKARDIAAGVFVDGLTSYDPATALRLLPQLASESAREPLLTKIARSWLKSDPTAAQKWLAEANLSEAQKRTLLGGRPPPN